MYDGNTMQPKSSFVHSDIIDEVLYGNIQGQDMYYHQDGLNSVKALTDGGGNEMARYDYDAWGNLTTTLPSIANPFTYTGREWDKETGLYYYRARYYDPKVGRFISKDPIGLAGGINLYSYVGNNPVNWIDPLGLFIKGCEKECKNPKEIRTWTERRSGHGGKIIYRGGRVVEEPPCGDIWKCTEHLCDDGRTEVKCKCLPPKTGGGTKG